MTHPIRLTTMTLGAILVLGLAAGATGPVPAAHAESGYRVCGVYNSSTSDKKFGTGLAVKIAYDDPSNETCSKKQDFMRRYYADAYSGSSGDVSFAMITCETFADRIGYKDGDICFDMDVNGIYRYTSKFDKEHPSTAAVSFWHR